ncbi:pyruvate/2-oxoglutarate dehydrogenase complex dihydrolipoamide acyltransferase (E2) component [Bradyrhizobium sp. S3.3.6]|uniref:cysteine rich repeat-containing protein n=1 Tax=Bradyrhizobium sp. S3.3.6 TaxID=3156429 RepID=UPI00339693BD
MFNTLKHVSTRRALLAAALFATATSAFAQAPTEAQKSAIRSACRSDFMAHCASVTPGGAEAYQCLQSHMSGLSSGCQTAVRAIEPAAVPKTEAAPAKSEPAKSEPAKTEAAPAAEPAAKPAAEAAPKAAAAKPPSSAQAAAVKSACRGDYPKVCASVPPGGAPALECLEKNKAKVSAACAKAVTAAAGGGSATATAAPAAAAAPAAGAAPAAAPTVIVLRPLRPREELSIVRSACGADIRTLCAGVQPGGGRIVQCIASNAASLSPGCKDVLAPFAAR